MHSCRVVLVRTEGARNLGSVARVMRNMGTVDLVLVDPVANPLDPQAQMMATAHAVDVLRGARVVPTLRDAIGACLTAVSTASLTGGLYRRQTVSTPEELMPQLAQLMTSGKIALVFGPEPSGLSNEEIAECHHLVSIPADENYPALNLAQAVAVCLYALRVAWLSQEAGPGEVEELATFDELERMFTVLQKGLSDVGYLRGDRGPVLWHAVRHLLTRARPSPMEVGLLFGLGRQLEWYTSQHSKEKGEQDPRPQRGNAEE